MIMFRTIGLLTLVTFFCFWAQAAAPGKILIRLQLAPGDSSHLEINQHEISRKYSSHSSVHNALFKPGSTKITSWEFSANEPIGITITFYGNEYCLLLEQGNDITIKTSGRQLKVSGPGSEMFDVLNNEILPQFASLTPPPDPPVAEIYKSITPLKNMAEFNSWNTYFDEKSKIVHKAIDKYITRYPSETWDLLKARNLLLIEHQRWEKFILMSYYRNKYNLSHTDIKKIYNTIIFNKNLQWLLDHNGEVSLMEHYLKFTEAVLMAIYPISDGLDSKLSRRERVKVQLRIIDSLAKGRLKDEMITSLMIKKITSSIYAADEFLPLAFSKITYPEYKDYIKKSLVEYLQKIANETVPDFYFLDVNGNMVRRADMNYKTLVFHINDPLLSGPNELFREAFREFGNSSEVIFAEISYGSSFEKWQKETREKNTLNTSIRSFYAPQTGDHRDFIKNFYSVLKVTTMALYQYKSDIHQNILTSSRFAKALRSQKGDTLSAVLEVIRNETNKFDGPYIRTVKDTTFVHTIVQSKAHTDTLFKNLPVTAKVYTDPGTAFNVRINKSSTIPEARYPMPEKALFISDLEGNFNVFRELLLRHNVIDNAYNWTFNKGHLVITGDVFDRGKQVTACLWLIYELENKAREAGGHVHFILGNHEIMNLTGNLTYVYSDYWRFTNMLGLDYMDLHAPNTVLGKWLRTKNIVEIIGENLVVHGGISPEVNSLGLPVEKINDKHRDYLAGQSASPTDSIMKTILNGKVSPYWYRGYYSSKSRTSVPENVIDSTLEIFKVKRIITGHTMVKDVSSFYGGKVLNTDTHHASGDSEGLLIENNILYRVTSDGTKEKILLN